VDGTDRSDRVQVATQGTQVDVAGLLAETRIAGSETLDRLQVDTFAGKDQGDRRPERRQPHQRGCRSRGPARTD
jgi:hypothetical protein